MEEFEYWGTRLVLMNLPSLGRLPADWYATNPQLQLVEAYSANISQLLAVANVNADTQLYYEV